MRFDGEPKQWFAPSDAVAEKAKATFPAQGAKERSPEGEKEAAGVIGARIH